jgi:hypothetical protein
VKVKRVSKKWAEKYLGIDLSEFKGRKGKVIQTDGGRGTWNYDVPHDPTAELIWMTTGKTYWFIPTKTNLI